jgi:hypothetical protein
MSGSPPEEWGMPDAWVFAAIASADPAEVGATLAEVIGAADGINHAILTKDEIELAVRHLLGAGLIEVDGTADRFWLAEAGQQLRGRWRGGLFSWMEVFPPALRRLGPPRPTEWSLPPGAYEQATQAYHAAMRPHLKAAKRRSVKRQP